MTDKDSSSWLVSPRQKVLSVLDFASSANCPCLHVYVAQRSPFSLKTKGPQQNPALHPNARSKLNSYLFSFVSFVSMCVQTGWTFTAYTCILQVIQASCWGTLNSDISREQIKKKSVDVITRKTFMWNFNFGERLQYIQIKKLCC